MHNFLRPIHKDIIIEFYLAKDSAQRPQMQFFLFLLLFLSPSSLWSLRTQSRICFECIKQHAHSLLFLSAYLDRCKFHLLFFLSSLLLFVQWKAKIVVHHEKKQRKELIKNKTERKKNDRFTCT